MRILLVAPQPFYSPRGTPIAVRAAAQALGEGGHEVDILTLSQGEDVALPNVRVHRAPGVPFVRSVPIGPSVRKLLSDTLLVGPLRRMLDRGAYDVVHAVEDGALLAWWLHHRTGIPYVYDMDSHLSQQLAGGGSLSRMAAGVMAGLERRVLRDAAGVLAVCPALLEVATRHHPAETAALLPDGPIHDGDVAEPSAEIQALGGIRVVYVGNLQPYQGVNLLLDSFRSISREHPEARLVIVGGPPAQAASCARAHRSLVAEGKVHFLGPRPLEELGNVLAAAHVVASPRLKGVNTPMKIYSYLESARPLLATRLRTHTQVLNDDVACLVPATTHGMAEGLRRLVENPALRRRLGQAGRTLVRERYSPEQFRRRLHTFYRQLEERLGAAPVSTMAKDAGAPVP